MFGFEKRAKLHRLLSKLAAARIGKNARSSSAQSSLLRCGRARREEGCASCGMKFPRNLMIEIDVYRGKHSGLVVAEVEFPDLATCREFKPPRWFGREVTSQ